MKHVSGDIVLDTPVRAMACPDPILPLRWLPFHFLQADLSPGTSPCVLSFLRSRWGEKVPGLFSIFGRRK